MSSTPWTPSGTHSWTRTEDYQPGTPKERIFYLFLEEITDISFNWKLSVSENGGVLFTQKFYLGGASNTPTIAQRQADQILTQYLQGHFAKQ